MSSSRVVISILSLFFGFQLSTASHASARTWFVERDGSGDFIVIQDAVDAAASGDTVRIGLGRFDEKFLVTCPGWSEYVRVHVTQHELTIIGSGPGTIIGQVNPWEPEEGYHKGIATGSLWGNQILRIESLHLEHMRDGIYTGYEDTAWNIFEVSDCSFNGNEIDLWLLGIGGTAAVNNCDFQNYTSEGDFTIGWDQIEMEIRECVFRRLHHIYSTVGISLMRVQDIVIENCDFFEGTVGINLSSSGPTLI